MDLQYLTTQLETISSVKSSLLSYDKIRREIEEEFRQVELQNEFLEKCKFMEKSLEEERKNHAEELRLINQDINTLEDMMKNLRNEKETQQRKCALVLASLQSAREAANASMTAAGIDEQFEILEEEVKIAQMNLATEESRSQNSLPIFPLQQLLPFFKTPQFNRSLEQPSRVKKCENCEAWIHRNAPTCSQCKTKSRSKNPKRRKNKKEPP
ncbi:hypothetical protein WR25_27037 [Diploscapter pachys]|uniref:C4H2-type domain-containing protein n=1 Tax=Diploscapter pachys TaxID=2018661 RepID=A0A2A2KCP7_9BILA|nr:hypothetical protein WR25_27037 [Diploscapter pachys]